MVREGGDMILCVLVLNSVLRGLTIDASMHGQGWLLTYSFSALAAVPEGSSSSGEELRTCQA